MRVKNKARKLEALVKAQEMLKDYEGSYSQAIEHAAVMHLWHGGNWGLVVLALEREQHAAGSGGCFDNGTRK